MSRNTIAHWFGVVLMITGIGGFASVVSAQAYDKECPEEPNFTCPGGAICNAPTCGSGGDFKYVSNGQIKACCFKLGSTCSLATTGGCRIEVYNSNDGSCSGGVVRTQTIRCPGWDIC